MISLEIVGMDMGTDTRSDAGVPLETQLRNVVVNGVRMAYLEREADPALPELAPLLLLHSLLATAESLKELIAGLPTTRRVVAIDLLATQPVARATKLDVHQASLTDLIRDFMRSVGVVQPVIVGHSHGGVLALRMASADPAVAKGLVLLSPAHPFGGYRSHVVDFYLRQPGRMLALSIPLAPSWMILRAYNEAAGSKSRIRMRHLRPHLPVLRNRNTLRRVLDMLVTWDDDMAELRDAMIRTGIATPTLLIWGDEDPVVSAGSATELQAHLAESECATLAGMGHLLAEEAPEACAGLICAWLDRLHARDEGIAACGSAAR